MSTSNGARKGKAAVHADDSEDDVEMGSANGDDQEESDAQMEDNDEPVELDEAVLKKRKTRADFRELHQDIEDHQSNLLETKIGDLSKIVSRSNDLYQHVTAPSEAILDSRVLIAASEAGALKSRQLQLDANAFNTDEFLAKLSQFMGGQKARAGSEDRGGDEALELNQRWTKVGRALAMQSRRVPALDHMYGPMSIQVKAKKAKQARQKHVIDESLRQQGESLDAADVHKDAGETGKMVTELNKLLESRAGSAGMPYLEFIVNPDSFAQTVENMFYFSFLVKEGKVAIELDDTEGSPNYGDAICFTCEPSMEGDGSGSTGKKHQLIFELTQDVWKDAIKAYDITESIIPSRAMGHVPLQAGKKWQ